ncbi:hypothetical protein ACP4OV_001163 [Aristida adscensionis]
MGWAHAAVAMEEVLALVRGFVDVLVLAGGRTSSGGAATWSSGEVRKALRWALFFEEVFKNLRDMGQYEDSASELDAALAQLTSSQDFPKGLAGVRSETLSRARVLVIRHFLKAKTLSVENFSAILQAVVEMDIEAALANGGHNACQEFVKSLLDMNLSSLTRTKDACDVGLPINSDKLYAESMFMCHSQILVQEFQKGLDSASCASLAGRGLGTLLNSVKRNSFDDARNKKCAPAIPNMLQLNSPESITHRTSQMIDEFLLWKQWRAKCLSYLLHERTIRIVSGASLIFRAPKEQWMRVFEPLKCSAESSQSGIVEITELCLLSLISRRWNPLIEGFMSHTFGFIPISKQYDDLHQLLQGTSQDKCHDKLLDSEERDIVEYAQQSLQSKPCIFWLLPPVLTAAAMPPGSTLFKMYLAEIDKQFHEAFPANRKCNCREDGIERHRDLRLLKGFNVSTPSIFNNLI